MEYVPGEQNIGSLEAKKRLATGIAGVANALILSVVLLLFPDLEVLYAPIFLLFSAGSLGFIQYRQNFCVVLGAKGECKLDDTKQEKDLREDRKRALTLSIKAIAAGALGTLIVYVLGGLA